MAVNGDRTNYVSLWNVSDMTSEDQKLDAALRAQVWPGFPVNPVQPNPIHTEMRLYRPQVRPMRSFGGRRVGRKNGYTSLSNYNNMP